MEAGGKLIAVMPARVGHALGFVDGKADGQGVDRFASFGDRAAAAFADDALNVGFRHLSATDRPLHVEQPAFGMAA